MDSVASIDMSLEQYVTLGVIGGAVMNTSFVGMLCTLSHWLSTSSDTFWKDAVLMNTFNIACLLFQALISWEYFLEESMCSTGATVVNVMSHCFYVSFNVFLMYKAYRTSGDHVAVCVAGALLLLHRIGWAIADIAWSRGFWDVAMESCRHLQNRATGVGYISADFAVAISSLLISVSFNFQSLQTARFVSATRVLMQENILRSFIGTAVNAYAIAVCLSDSSLDLFDAYLSFTVQNFIYTVCVNSELYWTDAKKASSSKMLKEFLPNADSSSAFSDMKSVH
ncbi:hypothetical protein HDU80_010651 [Chytriomyces hyalinus]|nr:hypothetical protein HDU80_010651 [Chytriomyces hyalinus]